MQLHGLGCLRRKPDFLTILPSNKPSFFRSISLFSNKVSRKWAIGTFQTHLVVRHSLNASWLTPQGLSLHHTRPYTLALCSHAYIHHRQPCPHLVTIWAANTAINNAPPLYFNAQTFWVLITTLFKGHRNNLCSFECLINHGAESLLLFPFYVRGNNWKRTTKIIKQKPHLDASPRKRAQKVSQKNGITVLK